MIPRPDATTWPIVTSPASPASPAGLRSLARRPTCGIPAGNALSTDRADASGVGRRGADPQGPALFGDERQEAILAEISREGRASVTALAERFAVVGETIRRDLAELERRGVIRRVHGGAIPAEKVTFEPPIEDRASRMTAG
jgi:hypothetical protein